MRRTFAGFVPPLLAALAFTALPLGTAVAGPPEGASGKMVLDKVEDWVRHYRREKDDEKRSKMLDKLKQPVDARVLVVLGEEVEKCLALAEEKGDLTLSGITAMVLLGEWYGGNGKNAGLDVLVRTGKNWWRENRADLRRRARQLPR
jgi:hypothetical protein